LILCPGARMYISKIKLLNWLQGINFQHPVNVNRAVAKGTPLIAYKDPSVPQGRVRGNWYTFPSMAAVPNREP